MNVTVPEGLPFDFSSVQALSQHHVPALAPQALQMTSTCLRMSLAAL